MKRSESVESIESMDIEKLTVEYNTLQISRYIKKIYKIHLQNTTINYACSCKTPKR